MDCGSLTTAKTLSTVNVDCPVLFRCGLWTPNGPVTRKL